MEACEDSVPTRGVIKESMLLMAPLAQAATTHMLFPRLQWLFGHPHWNLGGREIRHIHSTLGLDWH